MRKQINKHNHNIYRTDTKFDFEAFVVCSVNEKYDVCTVYQQKLIYWWFQKKNLVHLVYLYFDENFFFYHYFFMFTVKRIA
jgi:hypothetical protein